MKILIKKRCRNVGRKVQKLFMKSNIKKCTPTHNDVIPLLLFTPFFGPFLLIGVIHEYFQPLGNWRWLTDIMKSCISGTHNILAQLANMDDGMLSGPSLKECFNRLIAAKIVWDINVDEICTFAHEKSPVFCGTWESAVSFNGFPQTFCRI